MRSGGRAILWLGALALGACQGDDARPRSSAPATEAPALEVEIVDVDLARRPRDGRPFVAGEVARLELRVGGGQPPYELAIASEPAGLVAASLRAEPSAGDASGVVVAGNVALAPGAPSGDYRIVAVATGGGRGEARARSETFAVIGAGAELAAAPGTAPFVDIVDAGGRRRASFHRGEQVTVRARVGAGVERATVRVHAPDGTELASTEVAAGDAGAVALPFDVPALALPGDYRVEIVAGETRGAATLSIADPPFPPLGSLAIDELRLRGGDDGRSPRAAELDRGEAVVVRARIGGVQSSVAGTLRLRDRAGTVVAEADLGEVRATARHPSARLYLQKRWRVPGDAPPGRYMLEIEVREDDLLSTTYRDVLLR